MKPLVGLAVATIALKAAALQPAGPTEPIGAILDAFRSHRIVALGEGRHTNEQGHAFRLALIRDPRFAATVNDIVVESGTAKTRCHGSLRARRRRAAERAASRLARHDSDQRRVGSHDLRGILPGGADRLWSGVGCSAGHLRK